LEDFYDWITG